MSIARRAWIALGLTAAATAIAWLLQVSGLAYWLWVAGVGLAALLALIWPARLFDLTSSIKAGLRQWAWHSEGGRHHAFGGISLYIESDARHEWLAGDDLQRLLGWNEPDDVLAARHSGRWRRDDAGRLMLRVDAVVDMLAHAPGRMDPRTVRLRRYLEREVLYPASQRRRRGAAYRRRQ